ncbi:hypothetical protein [Streptomyces sp. YIM S03343]
MADEPGRKKEVNRLVEAIEAIEAIEDDVECAKTVAETLDEWPQYQKRLREARQKRVQSLRAQGKTWPEIGALLGVSPQRAQAIAVGLSGSVRRKRGESTDGRSRPAE